MTEAESIVNCRSLTVENLTDPLASEPLTPNHLLTLETQVVLPPPGTFESPDLYSRKGWRRVQYLANHILAALAKGVLHPSPEMSKMADTQKIHYDWRRRTSM